jgi:DNA-binding NarL/FixJ family response regulator
VKKINIIIADSRYLSRKGLAMILDENADFNLMAEALNGVDLINLSKVQSPDLIIIDYTSVNFGIDIIGQIVKKIPKIKLLAITEIQTSEIIAGGLRMGINSHLLNDCDKDEIVEAIYKTALGERFLCGKITRLVMEEKLENVSIYSSCQGMNISDREMEIIALIAEGNSNKEIADKLFLSTHTITTHRKNIMNKIGVNNTAGLVLFAVRENLVSPNHFLFSTDNKVSG